MKKSIIYLMALVIMALSYSCSVDECFDCDDKGISKVDTLYITKTERDSIIINNSTRDTLVVNRTDTIVVMERDTIYIPKTKCVVTDTDGIFSLDMEPVKGSTTLLPTENLTFNILENGNAEIKGNVEGMYVNVTLTEPGKKVGSPIMNSYIEGEDPSKWLYWGDITGTVTDLKKELTFDVSLKGSSPQYGIDANNKSHEKGLLGFGAWFYVSGNCYDRGDFNFNIECN